MEGGIWLNYFELDISFGEGGDKYLLQVGQVGLETWCCIQEWRQCLKKIYQYIEYYA